VSTKDGQLFIHAESANLNGGSIDISIPDIPTIAIYGGYEVNLNSFSQEKLHLQCNQSYFYKMNQCRIGMLTLKFPESNLVRSIQINESNKIDSLMVTMNGEGSLLLNAIGKDYNILKLSDKIDLTTKPRLLNKIKIEGIVK
jgi:hypothetical protein